MDGSKNLKTMIMMGGQVFPKRNIKVTSPKRSRIILRSFRATLFLKCRMKMTCFQPRSSPSRMRGSIEDLPIEKRTPRSFLFGFKRLLTEWKFLTPSVYVEGKPVVQATVKDGALILDWADDKWAQLKELQEDPKFIELQLIAQNRLSKAAQGRSKGKGKVGIGI